MFTRGVIHIECLPDIVEFTRYSGDYTYRVEFTRHSGATYILDIEWWSYRVDI